MGKKASNCIIVYLIVTLVSILSLSCACFAAGKFMSAEKMWNMAEKKAKSIDSGAMIVNAKYNRGDRDLKFQRGEFIFYAPSNQKNSNFKIKIKDNKITSVKNARYGNLNSSGINPMPYKAVEAALDNGLDEWWQKYPNAGLYTMLIPRKYYSSALGAGDWVWRIEGSGPGLPEDIDFIVNAQTFEFLGKKVKPIKKAYQNITEEQANEQIKKILKDARKK